MRRPIELVVAESDRTFFDAPFALDEHLVVAVHEDVGDLGILEQRFDRPQTEQLVEDVDRHRLALVEAERRGLRLGLEQRLDQPADLGLGLLAPHPREALEVEPIEQLLVDPALDLLIVRMADVGGRGRPATDASER
jgi:hypothetical protein